MDALVSTNWLAAKLGSPDLHVFDASWHFEGRDAAAEYRATHIPGAGFMDLAEMADPDSDLPMMLPSAERFAGGMRALGVSDGDRIVLYDDSALHTSARAWWMLNLFGACDVAILDGGLRKWRAEGRPLASGDELRREAQFEATRDDRDVRTLEQMRAALATGAEQVVDARGQARFEGREPEPRAGVAPGHMPGAKNLPHANLFEADGTYKSKGGLRAVFEAAGIDLHLPVAATCGSGITAAIVAFAAHLLGNTTVGVYDGSWSEWGARADTAKVVRAA